MRKLLNPHQKANIAISAIKEDSTYSELSSKHHVHPSQISEWRSVLEKEAHALFNPNPKNKEKASNRNLDSERNGIQIFQDIFGYHPASTEDWNIMQSITYFGASRGIDTDGDLLVDSREAEIGTDPNNPDTDGDGFRDGVEVINGDDPLNK